MNRDTLENRILAFFDVNPEEELTAEDVLVKFGTSMNRVREILPRMAVQGLLSRRREVDGKSRLFVYSRAVETAQ